MTELSNPTTVVLADSREIFRNGLVAVLEAQPDLSVVASVATPAEALEVCGQTEVTVLLLGELVSECEPAGAAAVLNGLPSQTRPILIGRDTDRLAELIEFGFWGYLPQTASGAEVTRAVKAVAEGEFWAPRRMLTRMIRERLYGCGCPASSDSRNDTGLTRREVEILELVAQGYNNDQIASALFIGRSTVKTHLLRTFRKLDAVDRTSAVTIALQRKLIQTKSE